jgi:hypothetical protein
MARISPIAILFGAAAVSAVAIGAGAKPAHGDTYRGVSRAKMIATVKASPLKLIDYDETYCDGDVPIGGWLTRLTAADARSVDWSAGKCELINAFNPLDSGGSYCVQATVNLKHPLAKEDTPTLEFYLEDPKGGKLGEVYAFRDVFYTPDGDDYERERRFFEEQWRERFADTPPPPCEDD